MMTRATLRSLRSKMDLDLVKHNGSRRPGSIWTVGRERTGTLGLCRSTGTDWTLYHNGVTASKRLKRHLYVCVSRQVWMPKDYKTAQSYQLVLLTKKSEYSFYMPWFRGISMGMTCWCC